MNFGGCILNISEVSEKLDLSADTLRYYERIGLIPPVQRSRGGIRIYQDEDIKWIEFVICMRQAGLPIEVLKEYLQLFEQGDSTLQDRKEILIEQRQTLMEKIKNLQEVVERLDFKVENYNSSIQEAEKKLLRVSG